MRFILCVCGWVKFLLALAYLFCLALPRSWLTKFAKNKSQLCTGFLSQGRAKLCDLRVKRHRKARNLALTWLEKPVTRAKVYDILGGTNSLDEVLWNSRQWRVNHATFDAGVIFFHRVDYLAGLMMSMLMTIFSNSTTSGKKVACSTMLKYD